VKKSNHHFSVQKGNQRQEKCKPLKYVSGGLDPISLVEEIRDALTPEHSVDAEKEVHGRSKKHSRGFSAQRRKNGGNREGRSRREQKRTFLEHFRESKLRRGA